MPRSSSFDLKLLRLLRFIIDLGTGLIRHSPILVPVQAFVTLPTPIPFNNNCPCRKDTVEQISALWVTSGSSPASFITDVSNRRIFVYPAHAISKLALRPLGKETSMCFLLPFQ